MSTEWIVTLCALGLLVSAYGMRVERKVKRDPSYTPLCNVGGKVMCSPALTSKYSHLLGISNSALGMMFYPAVAVLAILGLETLVLLAVIAAAIGSLVLAYLLVTRIKEICLVCSSIYVINLALLVIVL